MCRRTLVLCSLLVLLLGLASSGAAQGFDTIGTRAQGMAGAFVGVSDDATAVYWNPGGLAAGAYFSLVADGTTGEVAPSGGLAAGHRSGWLLAFGLPAVGVSYYRLSDVTVLPAVESLLDPAPGDQVFRLQSLVTHHAGVTLVQSLMDGIAVGTTVKLVRGTASWLVDAAPRAEDLLERWEAPGRSETKGDLDIGVMATATFGSLGLTVRNLTNPSFESESGLQLELRRQVRIGGTVVMLPGWKLAADVDLTRNKGPIGDSREVAVGSEGRLGRRLTARGGFRLNTASGDGVSPAVAAGASFAVIGGVFVDAQVTGGSDDALRGWGVSGRVVF